MIVMYSIIITHIKPVCNYKGALPTNYQLSMQTIGTSKAHRHNINPF